MKHNPQTKSYRNLHRFDRRHHLKDDSPLSLEARRSFAERFTDYSHDGVKHDG